MTAPVRNEVVVARWYEGDSGKNHQGSLTTDGQKLYSYSLQIGDTCAESGIKILRDYSAQGNWGYKSQTTSCHVGIARRSADLVD